MGQKINPDLVRYGKYKEHLSLWIPTDKNVPRFLEDDFAIRNFIEKNLSNAFIGRVDIERHAKKIGVTIHTARPGAIIGKKGSDAEELKKKLSQVAGASVQVTIKEIRKPEIHATLVAKSIAQQLERRVMFRRAMKRSIGSAMKLGAKGIKICISGRLGGAEIARSEWAKEGRIPLQTFRANIDYGFAEAKTTYGIIGVKVWIYKGDVLATNSDSFEKKDKQN